MKGDLQCDVVLAAGTCPAQVPCREEVGALSNKTTNDEYIYKFLHIDIKQNYE